MKCAIEKAIRQQWLKTKAVAAGANAVIDTMIEYYGKELEKLPENERKDAVVGIQEFFDYLHETKKTFNEEMGTD